MKEIPSFLIAAPSSGSGKTTITLGLLRALKNKGYTVQPFKCGPDYIDTKFHQLASGNNSVNLDLFLSSKQHVEYLYQKYASKSDICIAEGVMGLFDGYDRMKGSSADIAEILNIPVILVVNAKSVAYSIAPLLYGFKNFHKKINLAGVIFNFVGSDSHYGFLKEACDDVGVTSFGYLPKNADIEIPSRHLGLNLDKKYRFDEFAETTASLVEKYIDVKSLLSTVKTKVSISPVQRIKEPSFQNLKIAVASDEAFNFVYHENIEYLKKLGVVTFFSPLKDSCLPDTYLVYLPGGYPELYLKELSRNKQMLESIRIYAANGGRILAECGGMMYLSDSIADNNGKEYAMAGIFKQKSSMQNMKLKLGYRRFSYNGMKLKGHEFHYSTIQGNQESVCQQFNAKNIPVDTKLLRDKNAIAGYTHLYWADIDNLFDLFN